MSNPAEELRLAREAAGLSLEDIEKMIRVQSHYLRAIEESNFFALPGYSYTRAIIRSYAKCLGVPSEPILRYYEEHSQASTVAALTSSQRPLPSRKDRYASRKSRNRGWKFRFPSWFSSKQLLVGSLLLIFLLGLTSTFYFFDFFGSKPKEEETASVEASSLKKDSPQSAAPKDESQVTVRLVKTSESNKHGDEYAIDNVDKVTVTIKASAESWFRARGGGPTHPVMKDGYIQAGKKETFTHSEWISLHLGKPDQIELHVNGYLVETEGQKDPQTYQFRLDKKTDKKTEENS